jgi:hypothetical protein
MSDAWMSLYQVLSALGFGPPERPCEVDQYRVSLGWPMMKVGIALDGDHVGPLRRAGWSITVLPIDELAAATPVLAALGDLAGRAPDGDGPAVLTRRGESGLGPDPWARLYELIAAFGYPRAHMPCPVGDGEVWMGWPDIRVAVAVDEVPAGVDSSWTVVVIPTSTLVQAEPILEVLSTVAFARRLANAANAAQLTVSRLEQRLLAELYRCGLPEPDRNLTFRTKSVGGREVGGVRPRLAVSRRFRARRPVERRGSRSAANRTGASRDA